MILATVLLAAAPFQVSGTGFLTDSHHPMRPGDFRRYDATLRIAVDPAQGLATIAVETGEGDKKDVDQYFVRRGRTFQVDGKGQEIPADKLGDVPVAAIAALHPSLVASAIAERRQDLVEQKGGRYAFSWNDVLWVVTADKTLTHVTRLTRRDRSDVHGDGTEEVLYEGAPTRVTVRRFGREIARFAFGAEEPVVSVEIPTGDERRERSLVVRAEEIAFTEIAPHLYATELPTTNSRVFVAEFSDHVFVLEGVYSPRNGDLLVAKIEARFGKPIRYSAFSHLHSQYVGCTRSFIAAGATVVVPPTTAPLIEQIAAERYDLLPDRLSRAPRVPKIETVKESRRFEDATNAMVAYNVVSEHTDEYFIFWFPGPRVLITGDLLFYRPGQPLSGRSKRVCRTVADLGLDVDRCVATWPLDRYGTKNIVSAEEMKGACTDVPQ